MRALKVLVVGMGVLIVVGTVTLVVLVIQRASKAVPSAPSAPAAVAVPAGAPIPAGLTLGQPAGSRIGGIAPGGEGRVAVWVQRPDGDRVVILDTRSGQAAGEIRLGE